MTEFMVGDKVKLAKRCNRDNIGKDKVGIVKSIKARDVSFPRNNIRVMWKNLPRTDRRRDGYVYVKRSLVLVENTFKRIIKKINQRRDNGRSNENRSNSKTDG